MPWPEGKNPPGALQQLQHPSSVTPSPVSVIQFLAVSLCFHKTLACCARIFHVSAITTARPLPGPIFSLLQLFSTSAACLKFSSISLTLRSSWRICRASWTIYKYQSFSSYLSRTILCYFKEHTGGHQARPSIANREGNQHWVLGSGTETLLKPHLMPQN